MSGSGPAAPTLVEPIVRDVEHFQVIDARSQKGFTPVEPLRVLQPLKNNPRASLVFTSQRHDRFRADRAANRNRPTLGRTARDFPDHIAIDDTNVGRNNDRALKLEFVREEGRGVAVTCIHEYRVGDRRPDISNSRSGDEPQLTSHADHKQR